jgi:hypothetical protein
MNTWFNTSERIEALDATVLSWNETPFRANACIKGAGVCCHLYVAEVFMEMGALKRRAFPFADPNHSLTQTRSLIEPFMASLEGFVEITGTPIPGDVLGFKIGGCTHHIAVALKEHRMSHAVRRYGVMINRFDDPMWASRLTRIWRLQ